MGGRRSHDGVLRVAEGYRHGFVRFIHEIVCHRDLDGLHGGAGTDGQGTRRKLVIRPSAGRAAADRVVYRGGQAGHRRKLHRERYRFRRLVSA